MEQKEKSTAKARQVKKVEKKFSLKDTQKVLVSLNRDTGFSIILPEGTPVDKVPDGSHVLPFIGTEKQILRKINQMRKNPSLIEKYAVL